MKKKVFDAVQWMRDRRITIDDEDKGLDWNQKSKKTHDLIKNDLLWQRFKRQAVSAGNLQNIASSTEK
jgi:hypothetical protein